MTAPHPRPTFHHASPARRPQSVEDRNDARLLWTPVRPPLDEVDEQWSRWLLWKAQRRQAARTQEVTP